MNTHVSQAMTGLIAARDWLTVHRLPPYAHELSPVESVWAHLKRSLANLARHSIGQLTALVKTRIRQMQYRPGLLDGFLARTGLDLTPALPTMSAHSTPPVSLAGVGPGRGVMPGR
jgi:putative transposase